MKKGGLDYRVASFVDATPHEPIVPVYRSVRQPAPEQLSLFDFHGHPMSQSSMGLFYELMGRGLRGGELYGSRRTPKPGYPRFFSNPDLVDLSGEAMRESKANCTGRTLILRDGQIDGYMKDQCGYPDWNIRSLLFRHSFPHIRAFEGPEKDLFSELAHRTLYGFDLPLPVLMALHDGYAHNNGQVIATRSEDHPSFPAATRVSKGFLNKFFFEPYQALNDLGLNSDDYSVQRGLSPEGFKIAGRIVQPFPLVSMEHLDIRSWRQGLVERVSSHMRSLEGCSDVGACAESSGASIHSAVFDELPF